MSLSDFHKTITFEWQLDERSLEAFAIMFGYLGPLQADGRYFSKSVVA